jgi:hypothetical protein
VGRRDSVIELRSGERVCIRERRRERRQSIGSDEHSSWRRMREAALESRRMTRVGNHRRRDDGRGSADRSHYTGHPSVVVICYVFVLSKECEAMLEVYREVYAWRSILNGHVVYLGAEMFFVPSVEMR